MKKNVFFALFILILLCMGCEEEIQYVAGDIGPSGGLIFYDCDADNDTGNGDGLISLECGWRYLEAAPADITVDASRGFVFGEYRTSPDAASLFVNGSTYVIGTASATDGKSTGTAIGTGKANTIKLINKMVSTAYTTSDGIETTANYAAKLCDDYEYGGYDDWFLPSKDELNLIYTNLMCNGLGGFVVLHYWSSSESDSAAIGADCQNFYSGNKTSANRGNTYRVRLIRAF